jgi:MFS family permease
MERQLKLNYKRTMLIGFAFFTILMVWQAYNFYCPLFLNTLLSDILQENNATQYSEFIVGAIMALDNVLALFMLPIFGKLSDKTKTKYGKRMPYIILGMIATVIVFPFMALCYIWNSLVGLIVTMLVVLVIMNIYRSPAVALMPDVTPKPLRSTANGLINLVGYFGPILITVVNMIPFLKIGRDETSLVKLLVPVGVVLISLIVSIIVLVLKINEPKILEEVKEDLDLGEKLSTTVEKVEENKELSKADKRNMWILLIAVCLWYMCFNAFETFNSTYTTKYYSTYTQCESLSLEEYNALDENGEKTIYYIEVKGEYEKAYEYVEGATYYVVLEGDSGSGIASTGTIILTVTSVITFAVAGFFASKFGRKACVLVGVGLLGLGCFLIYILGAKFQSPSAVIYLYFVLLGVGWALINVNSYPMMVEMSTRGNIGKYTGLYYTSNMLAQSFTPILLGAIIAFVEEVTLKHLFLYSTVMAILAFAVLMFFKENKAAIKDIKVGLDALDQD